MEIGLSDKRRVVNPYSSKMISNFTVLLKKWNTSLYKIGYQYRWGINKSPASLVLVSGALRTFFIDLWHY